MAKEWLHSFRMKKWQPTSVLLNGKLLDREALAGFSPWAALVGHDLATKALKFATLY